MTELMKRLVIMLLAIALTGGNASLVLAGPAQTTRFSNWEFTPPDLMQKAMQTGDELVLKLNPSIPGKGGTITLRAGQSLKGKLAAHLDTEWKRAVAGRKLRQPEPDESTELSDGTKGLKRGAWTADGGYFSVTAFQAPGGINYLIFDAGDEMANGTMGGLMFSFMMTLKLH